MVSNGEVLPLGMDLADTGAASVVEAIPRVPAPSVPAHLDEPRPHLRRGASIVVAIVEARLPSGISSRPG